MTAILIGGTIACGVVVFLWWKETRSLSFFDESEEEEEEDVRQSRAGWDE